MVALIAVTTAKPGEPLLVGWNDEPRRSQSPFRQWRVLDSRAL